jgi:hypothetical protein
VINKQFELSRLVFGSKAPTSDETLEMRVYDTIHKLSPCQAGEGEADSSAMNLEYGANFVLYSIG